MIILKSHFWLAVVIIFTQIVILCSFGTAVLASSMIDSITSASENSSSMWFRGANMPTPRTDFTGAVLNDKFYVIGGFNNEGKTTDIVEFYDPETDTWETGPPLPVPLDHAAAATYNHKLYVVGGYKNDGNPSETLFVYNPSTDKWQKGSPLPTAKGALTANFINGTLYAVGGVDESGVSDSNLAYDPIANAWTEKKPMPTPREHLASSVVDGKLFVVGGRDWVAGGGYQANFDVNEAYDPIKDTWIVLEPMHSKRGGLAAAASSPNGSIYVFGGEEPGGTFNNNEKYDPQTDKWSKDIPMPTARHGLVAVTIDDKIYVVGGGLEPGLSVSGLNEIFLIGKGQKE
jgi:N-acetylneuraminic acid mutarotase